MGETSATHGQSPTYGAAGQGWPPLAGCWLNAIALPSAPEGEATWLPARARAWLAEGTGLNPQHRQVKAPAPPLILPHPANCSPIYWQQLQELACLGLHREAFRQAPGRGEIRLGESGGGEEVLHIVQPSLVGFLMP